MSRGDVFEVRADDAVKAGSWELEPSSLPPGWYFKDEGGEPLGPYTTAGDARRASEGYTAGLGDEDMDGWRWDRED